MCSRRQRRPPTRIKPSRPRRPKPRPRTSSRTSSRTQHPCRPRRLRAGARWELPGSASPPPAPKSSSTRGRSLSPSSSRGDLVEDGKTASPPSTPLPPRTDPPSPTSAGSLQAPAFCVDDDVTTPIKLPPQPEVASPFDPARPRRPPTVECDADAAARNVQALLAALGTPTKRVATKPPPAPDDDTTRFARQALEASGRDSEDASSAAKALATHGSGLADGLALLRSVTS